MPRGLQEHEVDLIDLAQVPTGHVKGMSCGGMGCDALGPTHCIQQPPKDWVCTCFRGWMKAMIRRGVHITRSWLQKRTA